MMMFGGMTDRGETNCIIVHHSDGGNGSAESIRRDHVENRGWEDAGYHYIITNGNGGPDGEIQKGRPLHKQGAHAKNKWANRNLDSVGVCLVGKNTFTKNQKDVLVVLLVDLCLRYKLEPSKKTIQIHHKDCPGPGLDLNEIIQEVKEFLNFLRRFNMTLRLFSQGLFFTRNLEECSNSQLYTWLTL